MSSLCMNNAAGYRLERASAEKAPRLEERGSSVRPARLLLVLNRAEKIDQGVLKMRVFRSCAPDEFTILQQFSEVR